MYAEGRGVEQNDEQAVFWSRKAGDQGDDCGQFILGVMYKTGRGVEQDAVKSVYWYRISAEGGNASAIAALKLLGIDSKNN